MSNYKTYQKKAPEVTHKWILIDVSGIPVGRAATFIASRLTGKYDPSFTSHIDDGDYVVVTNADNLVYNGNARTKKYYRHSQFPGALKEETAEDISLSEVLRRAVKGMLPKNKLQEDRLARLRVYGDDKHEHLAQQPEKVEVK